MSKQELLQKFAAQTGAEVPGVEPQPPDQIEIQLDSELPGTEAAGELFKDSYTDRTKVKPWEQPGLKMAMVSLCVLPFTLGAIWIFKDGIPRPKLTTKAPQPLGTNLAENDQPRPATDGEWASYAATNGMRQQFAAAARDTPDPLLNPQPVPPVQKKISASRQANSAPSIVGRDNSPSPYPPVVRSYSPPAPAIVPYRPVVPPGIAPAPRIYRAYPHPEPGMVAQTERSPQERIAAILAVTATPTNTTSGSVTAATSPSDQSQNSAYLPAEDAILDNQPQTLIRRTQSAKGKLVNGIAFTANDYAALVGQPVEIQLLQPLGQLPTGARIITVVEGNNRDSTGISAVVRLKPTAIVLGDAESPIDPGVLLVSRANGSPLIAQRGGSAFLRLMGGLAGSLISGAALTNLGASQNVQFGNASYLTAIGTNAATNLVGNAAQQLQQSGQSEVWVLKAGTEIRVSVLKPFALPDLSKANPIPTGNEQSWLQDPQQTDARWTAIAAQEEQGGPAGATQP
uniref:Conjugation TrbI family protein n=1 Tax=Cyanothece sp. (strain PCC 7425 / ATCC 29141) TaxID=395961 RepID=B8HZ21_CYAP4